MVPEFVARTRGSKWPSALPTGSKWVQAQPAGRVNPSVASSDSSPFRGAQLVKKGFDKLVDGEASSPATATLTSLR